MKKTVWRILRPLKIMFPPCAWTFFDPALPRFAAGKKLALKRSDSFPGGRSAAAAWYPKNLQCA
jgi:hypothetical protein